MSFATPVVIRVNDGFPVQLKFIADISIDGYSALTSTYLTSWYVDGVFYSYGEVVDYLATERKSYDIYCQITDNGSYWVDSSITIDLTFVLNLQFKIYNNYGPAPLTFTVEDITDYNGDTFKPNRWTWYIKRYGCLISKMGVNNKTFTISSPGQYGIRMTVSDGITSYSIIRRHCVIVTGGDLDGSQIEFAHYSGSEIQRHLIKSNHSYTEKDKNSISFLLWGSEVDRTDIAVNEILKLEADEKIFTKSIYPFNEGEYDVGLDIDRWNDMISIYLDIRNTSQSKILKVWSGK